MATVIAAAASAQSATVEPFGSIPCVQVKVDDVLFCVGGPGNLIPSFDGTPIDLNVALPANVPPRDLPLVILSQGYGGVKLSVGGAELGGLDAVLTMTPFARLGYAVLSITPRGFGASCGPAYSAEPACQNGFIHGDDARYELRDIQYLAGILVDEGIVNPKRIGFTGISYGGGVSIEAAALKDRIMDTDGTLKPWTSPKGVPMRAAVAAPLMSDSDVVYAQGPNGRELDYVITALLDNVTPPGVMKLWWLTDLYNVGIHQGFYPPAGSDPQNDPITWFAAIDAGEPFDNPVLTAAATEAIYYQSAYYLDDSEAPAPMLLANGWADDLFPVTQWIQFYNRTRKLYPKTPIALIFLDFGHAPRAQNKVADLTMLNSKVVTWFNYFLKNGNAQGNPLPAVEALTETCPRTAKSGGPFAAANWVALHPGEVRLQSNDTQTFTSAGGDPTIAAGLISTACTAFNVFPSNPDEPNTGNWDLPAATGDGYTLTGAPTAIFDLTFTGDFPEVAGRLWDVTPTQGILPVGTETLVARGVYRPTSNGSQVFQLYPGAWHFAKGHVARFQLLGQDSPYARPSNGTFSISISNLDLRLPVHEKSDCRQVLPPAAPFVPDGAVLAPDVNAEGAKACGGR
jgi:hypothetical protein